MSGSSHPIRYHIIDLDSYLKRLPTSFICLLSLSKKPFMSRLIFKKIQVIVKDIAFLDGSVVSLFDVGMIFVAVLIISGV